MTKPRNRWSEHMVSKLVVAITIATLLMVGRPAPAIAQSNPDRFQLGVHVPSAISSQFDRTDTGVGGWFAWQPVELVGIESEVSVYPGEFPDPPAFSRGRVEGLFGVTVGPRFDSLRPFARIRSGFLNIREAPQPFACILIFPPPLRCELASGRTLAAFDVGGGVDVFVGRKTLVRVGASDRLLKYPAPVLDSKNAKRDDAFFSHDFRFAAGIGLQF